MNYKNNDTNALALVLNSAVGKPFHAFFEETVWKGARAERTGYWMLDKTGATLAASSMHASLRDWARMGLYMMDILKGRAEGGACLSQYMKDATSRQVTNPGPTGASFRAYGYQTWVQNQAGFDGFVALGYAGQRLIVLPNRDRLMYIASTEEGDSQRLYEIARRWQLE
jgi:CubicO group peptidase (beta-lactamase class C family)